MVLVSSSYHTKYHRPGELNKIGVFLTVLEHAASKIKGLESQVSF